MTKSELAAIRGMMIEAAREVLMDDEGIHTPHVALVIAEATRFDEDLHELADEIAEDIQI